MFYINKIKNLKKPYVTVKFVKINSTRRSLPGRKTNHIKERVNKTKLVMTRLVLYSYMLHCFSFDQNKNVRLKLN